MPLIIRTLDELNSTSINRLTTLGYTDAQYQGTGVRNILEAVNVNLADFYTVVNNDLSGIYLSQAIGPQLDGLGEILGTSRYAGEVDQSYRARLVAVATSSAGTNVTYLTQQLLALSAVRQVIAVQYTQGIGSITFYLVGVSGVVDAATLDAAQTTVNDLSAAGAYTPVLIPDQVKVNITGTLATIPGTTSSSEAPTAVQAIANYLNRLSMGSKMFIDQIVTSVLNADPSITDINFLTISTTDGNTGITTEQLIADYTPQFDQQLTPGSILLS